MNAAARMKDHIDATLRDPRWTQMRNRDERADGSFWYSVRSTGVYCKPSCAARPARPENVAFHHRREDAERAGFRPCARCRPDRVREALHYGIGDSPLGMLLVAASERGVCAILFGENAGALEADLRQRFAQTELTRDDAALAATLAQAAALIEHPDTAFKATLDLRGTPFQRKVWEALRAIPAGNTASYKEVALRIGMPDASRAVALACGANALAMAVPCHRVIRGDGSLSGYRWGVERKRALLEREARA
ncbi:methylated-DNA--[protein]-cysteine S-methyltransferase [Dyella sp. 2RAB6]|uniref:methylated-DNA--[protein]-cysteine S-methyltransferase n=1 Tax=Dyella sp. 2RAB6 TaxID=3232992 RepID=UPI003F90018F